jgi:hypothetical protein
MRANLDRVRVSQSLADFGQGPKMAALDYHSFACGLAERGIPRSYTIEPLVTRLRSDDPRAAGLDRFLGESCACWPSLVGDIPHMASDQLTEAILS